RESIGRPLAKPYQREIENRERFLTRVVDNLPAYERDAVYQRVMSDAKFSGLSVKDTLDRLYDAYSGRMRAAITHTLGSGTPGTLLEDYRPPDDPIEQ